MPVEDGDAQKDEGEEEQEEALDEDSTDAESGSDESGESGDDGNGSDEEPSTPPPPIELPDRTTRGKRLRAVCSQPPVLQCAGVPLRPCANGCTAHHKRVSVVSVHICSA